MKTYYSSNKMTPVRVIFITLFVLCVLVCFCYVISCCAIMRCLSFLCFKEDISIMSHSVSNVQNTETYRKTYTETYTIEI